MPKIRFSCKHTSNKILMEIGLITDIEKISSDMCKGRTTGVINMWSTHPLIYNGILMKTRKVPKMRFSCKYMSNKRLLCIGLIT